MKRLLLVLVLIGVFIVPVMGSKNSFQNYVTDPIVGDISYAPMTLITDPTTGQIGYGNPSAVYIAHTTSTTPFTYMAFTCSGAAGGLLFHVFTTPTVNYAESCYRYDRWELKIVGGTPTLYKNGIFVQTFTDTTVNPSSFDLYAATQFDNIVVGGTDHHITGSLPINWSIQRDLLNPAATGVYAWNPNTNAWVLKNSYFFYVDADKEGLTPETLSIRHIGGTVIDATVLSATHSTVQYNIADFLATSTAVGSTVPDGQYSVSWNEMSPPDWFADTFWITSSGGVVNWNADRYSQGDTATITYAISDLYFLPTTYTYNLIVQDMYGTTKATIPVNTQTGTPTVTLSSATYPAMVYNVLLEATKISDGSVAIMSVDSMEITGYVYVNGVTTNAENTTMLSGVSVNVSQGTTFGIATSGVDGIWNSTGNWLTGSPLHIVATQSGYDTYTNSFTPSIARSIPITIPMMPTTRTCVGTCMAGLVNDSVYHNPVSGATYWVQNGSYSYSTITNAAGYARVDSIVPNLLYDVWSSKVGYSNSTVAQKLAMGV